MHIMESYLEVLKIFMLWLYVRKSLDYLKEQTGLKETALYKSIINNLGYAMVSKVQ